MKRLFFIVMCFGLSINAFSLSGDEIVEKYFAINPAPVYSKSEFDVISYKLGKVDKATLTQYGRCKNSLVESAFSVDSSDASKGTRFLQAQKLGRQDEKWAYLPSLRTVRRLASGEAMKSFAGSEFSYNDCSLRDAKSDSHEFLSIESVKNDKASYETYKVKETPKSIKGVEYTSRVVYYDTVTYIPVRIEFYNKKGIMFKLQEVLEIKKLVDANGHVANVRWWTRSTNNVTGRKSEIHIKTMVLGEHVGDKYFLQNWLLTGK